jgi:CDP-diacylglycerol--glycerol-3-phosphate 3-phosphatidyltransferase
MLDRFTRVYTQQVMTPVAKLFLRLGISPDAVTIVGTLGVCAGALVFFPRGELFWGVIVVTAFVFSDNVDGVMARLSGRTSRWGGFLDSTLDRIGDGAVFSGLILYFGRTGQTTLAAVALACLVGGLVVSYARARAEGLGFTANVGVAERAERLVSTLVAAGIAGLGVPYILAITLWVLAVLTFVTIVQRMLTVRRQALAEDGTAGAAGTEA